MIKKPRKVKEFSDEEFLSYMKLPAIAKLRHMEKTSRFMRMIAPKQTQRFWAKLAEEGF